VLDTRILLFASLVTLATAVLAGSAPAYQASARDLSSALKSGEREGRLPRSATRTSLLVGQVALTLVLLTGAGLFLSSLRHVERLRLGFDADRLIVASVDLRALGYKRAGIDALYQQMRDRVKAVPGVTGASLAIGDPFRNVYVVPLEVPGLDSAARVQTGGPYVAAVTPDYFRTMGTAVRRGRAFGTTDIAGAQRVAVVNETMARLYWPGEDPVGKCLKVGGGTSPCTAVIGVVEDTRHGRVTDDVMVQYFIPLAQANSVMQWPVSALLVRSARSAADLVGRVRRAVQGTSPELPYPIVDPMPQLLAWQLRPWRLGSALLSLFGALGLTLAAIGLYGVLSYLVSQRTPELGVRMALGATARDVMNLVLRQSVSMIAVGVVIGAAAAWAAGRILARLVDGMRPTEPSTVAMMTSVLVAAAMLASVVPARRASRVDVLEALRQE